MGFVPFNSYNEHAVSSSDIPTCQCNPYTSGNVIYCHIKCYLLAIVVVIKNISLNYFLDAKHIIVNFTSYQMLTISSILISTFTNYIKMLVV